MLTGIDAYEKNVNMLAGRTTLGKILFEDASIQLHKVEQIESNKIQTRWTLKVTLKLLPWKPRAKFTGVSVYTLDTKNSNKIIQQDDYWDSINLTKGNVYCMLCAMIHYLYFLICTMLHTHLIAYTYIPTYLSTYLSIYLPTYTYTYLPTC